MKYSIVAFGLLLCSPIIAQLKVTYPKETTIAKYNKVSNCIEFSSAKTEGTKTYIPVNNIATFNGICAVNYRILQFTLFYYNTTLTTKDAVEDVLTTWTVDAQRHKLFNKTNGFFLDHIIAINSKGDTVMLSGTYCKVVK